jgi:hypothetical protein
LLDVTAIAQLKKEIKETQGKNKSNTVSLGPAIPIGSFSDTHKYGVTVEYSWTNHRFGLMKKIPAKRIGFILNTGVNYYLGKEETISSYQYKYRSFTYIHAYGGAIYNSWKKGSIHLTVGPATGIEDKIVEFWWGFNLSGSYYVNEKIAITPDINFMKQSIADPLLAVAIRATMAF